MTRAFPTSSPVPRALTTKPKTASATGPTTAADASAATAARGGPAGPSGRDATGAPAGTGVDVLGLNAFLFSTGTDNVDLFRVCGYAREGKVMVKVGGFADAQAARDAAAAAGTGGAGAGGGGAGRVDPRCSARGGQAEDEAGAGGEEEGAAGAPAHRASHTACLQALVSFLGALTSKDADGRVLVARTPTVDKKGLVVEPRLKFLLLTPASRFREVRLPPRLLLCADQGAPCCRADAGHVSCAGALVVTAFSQTPRACSPTHGHADRWWTGSVPWSWPAARSRPWISSRTRSSRPSTRTVSAHSDADTSCRRSTCWRWQWA